MRDKELFYEESHNAQIKRALDNVNKIIKPEETHPLLNADSPHYKMIDGVESIERMEQMYSIPELMHWAKITAMKYRLRIARKDDVLKEARKLLSYEAYYKYLEAKDAQD